MKRDERIDHQPRTSSATGSMTSTPPPCGTAGPRAHPGHLPLDLRPHRPRTGSSRRNRVRLPPRRPAAHVGALRTRRQPRHQPPHQRGRPLPHRRRGSTPGPRPDPPRTRVNPRIDQPQNGCAATPSEYESRSTNRGGAYDPRFETGITLLHRYAAMHGSSSPPRDATIDGFAIGHWVVNRRAQYRRVGYRPSGSDSVTRTCSPDSRGRR